MKILLSDKKRSTSERFITCLIICILMVGISSTIMGQARVTISEVNEVIPTYLAGPPDPNPMFFFGQGSQGAEGRIYPYPLYDN